MQMIGTRRALLGGSALRRPSLSLNFLAMSPSGILDPRVTFSRASSATYVNAAGILSTAASNVPRFDYSPTNIGTPLGLLVERQATNILTNALLNGTNLSNQTPTVAAAPYTLSFYGTGSVAMTGAYTGTATGTGAYPSRKTLTFTPSAGVLTMVITGTVQYAQLETNSVATSFIPTGGTSATRAIDLPFMTGSNFSSWWNQSQGTIVTTYYGDTVLNKPVYRVGTTAAGSIGPVWAGGSTVSIDKVGTGSLITNTTYVAGAVNKTALAFNISGMSATTKGGAIGTTATVMTTSNQLGIGAELDSTNAVGGHIQSLRFYPVAYSGTILQGL